MEMNMGKFSEKLVGLLELAKKKKNVLEYQEISDFFKDQSLEVEQMEKVLDFLEASGVDVLRISGNDEELILDDDADIEKMDDEEEIELDKIDLSVPEGVSIEDPVRMYLKEIGKVSLLTADEEIERLSQLIDPVLNASTVPVSIDTYHAKTADYAFSKGTHILNDVWGLHYDPDMAAVAAKYKVPVIIMHNSNDTNYGDIIEDMKAYFFFAVDKALKVGVTPQQIWLDPGIGFFGKTEEQNIEVMQRLGELTAYEYPILLAPSRKGFIGSMLGGLPPEERDEGTVAACITGVFQGVDMVRVHNVKMHKRALAVADGLLRGE